MIIINKGSTVLCDSCDQPLFIINQDIDSNMEKNVNHFEPIQPQNLPLSLDNCQCIYCGEKINFESILKIEEFNEDMEKTSFADSYEEKCKEFWENIPECIYQINNHDDCNPLEFSCDARCQGVGHCMLNPLSECYNMNMEDYKEFLEETAKFVLWFKEFMETQEGKEALESLTKRGSENETSV